MAALNRKNSQWRRGWRNQRNGAGIWRMASQILGGGDWHSAAQAAASAAAWRRIRRHAAAQPSGGGGGGGIILKHNGSQRHRRRMWRLAARTAALLGWREAWRRILSAAYRRMASWRNVAGNGSICQ